MANRRTTLIVVSMLCFVACSDGGASPVGRPATDQPAQTTGESTGSAPTENTGGLVVWSDAGSVDVMRSLADSFSETTGVEIVVQEVDIDDVRGEILGAGSSGRAPDIFIGEHVWAGELEAAGLVVPLDLDAARGRFLDAALDGFNVDGRLYAVPASVEAMAMYRNTGLVAEAPETWDELRGACASIVVDACVAVPGGGGDPDAYAQFSFLSAFGGFVFDYDDATGFDAASVGIDAAATVSGARFLEQQVIDGVIPDAGYVAAKQLFVDGRAAFWLSGPWELDAIAETGVAFAVSPIPTMGEGPARPFVGATGWYVSATSMRAELAQTFLVDHVATDDTQREFVASGATDSAWSAVAQSLPESSPSRAFAESAANGVAIPNLVAMADVWGPLGEGLEQLRRGDLGAADALAQAADEVRSSASD